MDRLLSKLQLGQIKVGPHSSFPPDADVAVESEVDAQPYTIPASQPAPPEGGALNGPGSARLVDAPTRAYRPGYRHGPGEFRSEVLKVSARSRPSAVAGAIAGVVRERGRAEVQAIGAGAVNQAIKAIAIARDYLHETGIEAVCLPTLVDLTIDDTERTAIRLVVETR